METRRSRTATIGQLFVLLALVAMLPARAQAQTDGKTTNYLFAASEALDDGNHELALSILEQARQDDPDNCILHEYLCRAHAGLGHLVEARKEARIFEGCMEPEDQSIHDELTVLVDGLAEADARNTEEQRGNEDELVSDEPDGSEGKSYEDERDDRLAEDRDAAPDEPSATGGPDSKLGPVLIGVGTAMTVGFSVTAVISYQQGQIYAADGNTAAHAEGQKVYYASLVGAGIGGALLVGGIISTAAQKNGQRTTDRDRGERPLRLTLGPGPGEAGLSLVCTF